MWKSDIFIIKSYFSCPFWSLELKLPPVGNHQAPADCNFIENWYIGKFLCCRLLKLLWSCPWLQIWHYNFTVLSTQDSRYECIILIFLKYKVKTRFTSDLATWFNLRTEYREGVCRECSVKAVFFKSFVLYYAKQIATDQIIVEWSHNIVLCEWHL